MDPFSETKATQDLDIEPFIDEIRNNARKKSFFLNAIRALLVFIKGFSINQEDIGADRFAEEIDSLSERFVEENDAEVIESVFEKYRKSIPHFIKRQKAYLRDREKELWDIIGLQRSAIASIDSENQDYHQKVYEQSEKIEAITQLDDIKNIKKRLFKEVETIRETLKEKQQQERERLDALAKQISLLNIELEKARTEGTLDDLTQAYNRKAFDNYIRKSVDQCTTKRSRFSLLMLDIDDFKRINDAHGHQIGDRVLVALVEKCKEFIRGEDFLARYGGEEFAIILPGASLKNALKKARRIRKAVAGTHYTAENQIKGQEGISITVSIGVASFEKNDSISTLIDRADRALYEAKRTGKNRVVGA